jgi:hypothetical protein
MDRHLFTIMVALTGCFEDVVTDAPARDTSDPVLPVESEASSAEPGMSTSTTDPAESSESSESSSTTTTTSTSTTTSTTTTTSTSTGDATTTGDSCEGSCEACMACATEGPCADEHDTCDLAGCGTVPGCIYTCAQALHSCEQCCVRATLGASMDLMACVEQQCGDDCSFSCG